jgi:hypothetical protein
MTEQKTLEVKEGVLQKILIDLISFVVKTEDGAHCSASTHFNSAVAHLQNLLGDFEKDDPVVQEALEEMSILGVNLDLWN